MPHEKGTDGEAAPQRAVPREPVRRALLALGLTVTLSACATSVNKLDLDQLAGIRIEAVDITFAPKAHIRWRIARNDYFRPPDVAAHLRQAAEQSADEFARDEATVEAKVMNSPEARAYMCKRVHDLIDAALARHVLPLYQGSRPVRLHVTVAGFSIPSAVARVIVGGAPSLAAISVLKDAGTGEELAKLDNMTTAYAGGGVLGVALDQAGSNLEDRVVASYIKNVLQWLGTPTGAPPPTRGGPRL